MKEGEGQEGRCRLGARKGGKKGFEQVFNFLPNFLAGILCTCYSVVILGQNICTVLAGHQSSHKKITKSCHSLSWKSLVKNFRTRLQNLAERFSLAVAIMICTSSPLGGRRGEKGRITLSLIKKTSASISSQCHLP